MLLEVKLEVVSRPGVLFCARNAAAKNSVTSKDPKVIRFEIVKKKDHFALRDVDKAFYQGEVLVPGCVPAHLIRIPKVDIFNRSLETRETDGRLHDSFSAKCSLRNELKAKVSASSSSSNSLSHAVGAGTSTSTATSTPEPLVSLIREHLRGKERLTMKSLVSFVKRKLQCFLGTCLGSATFCMK